MFLSVRKAGIEASVVRPQAELRAEIARLEAGGGRGERSSALHLRLADLQVRSSVAAEELRVLRAASFPERACDAATGPGTPPCVRSRRDRCLAMARDAMRRRVDSTRELEQLVEHLSSPARATPATTSAARLAVEAWVGPGRVVVVTSGSPGVSAAAAVGRLGRAFAAAGQDVFPSTPTSPGRRCTIDSGCPWTRGSAACSSVSPRARASARPPCAAHRRPCHGRRAVAAWPS